MVQYKRAVAEVKVCLIEDFGSVRWRLVQALLYRFVGRGSRDPIRGGMDTNFAISDIVLVRSLP